MRLLLKINLALLFLLGGYLPILAQGTKLLRQPSISTSHITFTYGSDIWIAKLDGSEVRRITSTAAVESSPILSPDGKTIAFTSNREGVRAVYTVPVEGGTPKRITWHPMGAQVSGWSPDGSTILYASARDFAPRPSNRLWTVPANGGNSTLVSRQRGVDGSFSPDGSKIVLDVISRWEAEFRGYRGGQNTPLVILNLSDQSEELIPNDKTIDIQPIWIGENIYFLSDRAGGVANIWAYSVASKSLTQLTTFEGADVKWLSGNATQLVFEREGQLNLMNLSSKAITTLSVTISGDFPWAEPMWETITDDIQAVSLSAKGKRLIMEARGEVFTVPIKYGETRNLTQSPLVADRKPLWSPKGDQVAWFSDQGHQKYVLKRASQDGMQTFEDISIGESHYAWEPTWSPDGKHIAFVDDDLRVRVIDLSAKTVETIGLGGINIERGNMGLSWSPDSQWLAYSKSGSNNFRRIMVWSKASKTTQALTNSFADAFSPAWDRNGKQLYFLASTDVALGSGWTNTSAMTSRPEYAAYVVNLNASDSSPFKLRSDEEEVEKPEEPKEEEKSDKKKGKKEAENNDKPKDTNISIDFENIERRIIPLPIPERNYWFMLSGPKGAVFIAESVPQARGLTIQKFTLKDREAKQFAAGARQMIVSADGKKAVAQVGSAWKITDTGGAKASFKNIQVRLEMKLNRSQEWKQMFEEAWRYEKDYFYDPNLHGRDWDEVYERYSVLIPHVKHRADLNYVFDQMNGELSVGHSFVGGGDYPKVGTNKVGLLGADLMQESGRWKISRIFTTENWNPNLTSPLDQPGLKVKEGNYLVGINGKELTANDNPYERLDGTLNKQTVLHINAQASFENSWTIVIKPIRSEVNLRQRAWVEDNRRMVDSLSNGKLAYVWVPNTSGQGLVSFNRYFFAQQDKLGAVIDERYNGGGLLDDYMVDLMTRKVRAAYTNEVPNAAPKVMPGGILGPKVLLINEMAGSGGDFFPWVFRQQKAGKLIGKTTWGGLVKSSVHYRLVDGGYLTSPDNAIFDPAKNEWIAENTGIAPDIEVRQDAKSLSEGRDPQLERAVAELLKSIDENMLKITQPKFSTPASNKE